ncbi:hypothetical protein [Nocardia fusca]|uniref:Uncharacterized protein n=1 Tax=Nocardia fusca TaxID=941183 RepID=A0ABV3FA86_9NOCA
MSAHDDLNTANAKAARAAGWPELTGSPKQIPWATTARTNKIYELVDADITDLERDRYREVVLRETSAAVWLDSRDQPWQVRYWGGLTQAERDALMTSGGSAAAGPAE